MHHVDAPVPKHVSSLRTVLTRDANELARNLTNWEQSYDQISSGSFHGALDELDLPGMQVFRESISQSVRQSCRVRPDAIWFGFTQQPDATRINGRLIGLDAVMIRPGNHDFELLTPSSHIIYGIVVDRKLLLAATQRSCCVIDWQRLLAGEVLKVAAAERSACVAPLAALLVQRPNRCSESGMGNENWLLLQQNRVLESLLVLLDRSVVEAQASRSFQRRCHIVARARDYILAHKDQAITMPQLCEQAHVSRRTLQYCFEDVLDMSPMFYLRRVRLNGVRRQLLDPDSGSHVIGAVAADWGFDNFSQFSSDYRKLFGESASASLKLPG